MKSYAGSIDNILENNNYIKVLYTISEGIQLVTMSLKPGEEIGMKFHPDTTQFFPFLFQESSMVEKEVNE